MNSQWQMNLSQETQRSHAPVTSWKTFLLAGQAQRVGWGGYVHNSQFPTRHLLTPLSSCIHFCSPSLPHLIATFSKIGSLGFCSGLGWLSLPCIVRPPAYELEGASHPRKRPPPQVNPGNLRHTPLLPLLGRQPVSHVGLCTGTQRTQPCTQALGSWRGARGPVHTGFHQALPRGGN